VTVETNSLKKTEILTQRCMCVGCQLNSDQILGLTCLKGHVRVPPLLPNSTPFAVNLDVAMTTPHTP